MFENGTDIFFILDMVAFLTVVFMHLARKNHSLIRLYAVQSLAVGLLLFGIGITEKESGLIWVAGATILVKVILAPVFFGRLMRRFQGQQTASNYVNTPLTLAILTALIMLSYSKVFLPLSILFPEALGYASLNVAALFMAVFLLINRRGVFSQMIGVLSIENSIVLFAAFVGLRQPAALEIGILFDIVIWMVISTVFIRMIYRQFGTLNAVDMKRLTE